MRRRTWGARVLGVLVLALVVGLMVAGCGVASEPQYGFDAEAPEAAVMEKEVLAEAVYDDEASIQHLPWRRRSRADDHLERRHLDDGGGRAGYHGRDPGCGAQPGGLYGQHRIVAIQRPAPRSTDRPRAGRTV